MNIRRKEAFAARDEGPEAHFSAHSLPLGPHALQAIRFAILPLQFCFPPHSFFPYCRRMQLLPIHLFISHTDGEATSSPRTRTK
jgi:hypothetical protein